MTCPMSHVSDGGKATLGVKRNCQDPPSPFDSLGCHPPPPPCLLSSAHRYPGLFCFRPAAPEAQGSNPRTGGGWDPLSRPQPQPSFLTPTPAASISTQMAEPEATLSLHFLSLP